MRSFLLAEDKSSLNILHYNVIMYLGFLLRIQLLKPSAPSSISAAPFCSSNIINENSGLSEVGWGTNPMHLPFSSRSHWLM